MSDFNGLFEVRDATIDDLNFIVPTFVNGLYHGDSWYSQIPYTIFKNNYTIIIQVLVTKSVVKIACLPEDTNVILGYSILSQDFLTVHWVYVKKKWRQRGIAKALLPKHPVDVTHLTLQGKELLPKLNGAIFNPFKLGEV